MTNFDDMTPEERARTLALNRLAMRETSARELSRFLVKKGVDRALADETVKELAAKGYVDDQRFARAMTRHQSQRGKGPLYVANKLREKGVRPDANAIKGWMQESRGEQSEIEAVREI